MVYLIYGTDNFLKDQYLRKLKKSFGDLQLGINFIQVDDSNVDKIISDIETPAFGFEKKIIFAKNCGLFTKKNYVADSISEYINEHDISDVELVFIEDTADKNKLYTTIEKVGEIKEFKELSPMQLVKEIVRIGKGYNVTIPENVAQYIVECCGTNMQDIINEIRKLIEYAGPNGTVKKEDVDALVIKKSESAIFDLTDQLGKKNIAQAIETLHNLQYYREPTQMILIMLYRHFKKLYLYKLCNGNNVAETLKLKPNQTFLIRKYGQQASYFKVEELEKIIEQLINLDENSKNGNIDLDIGLESILCRYC